MSDKADPVTVKSSTDKTCGIIMPISEFDGCPATHWEDVRRIIESSVQLSDQQFRTRLVSEGDETGVIHKRIIQNVYSDEIAVCDVSGRNPNVLFELGMRLAFDRPIVIIKDDKTPFMFDTGLIEHLSYPRDLRHGQIEAFKKNLAVKLEKTYAASLKNPESVSFIKSFGQFKVVSIEEVKEPADKAVVSLITEVQSQIHRLTNVVNRLGERSPSDAILRMSSAAIQELAEDFVRRNLKVGRRPDFQVFRDEMIARYPISGTDFEFEQMRRAFAMAESLASKKEKVSKE